MSLAACMSRWPATTRCPWLENALLVVNRSRTEASASLTCRRRGEPLIAVEQQRDPRFGPDAAHPDYFASKMDEPVLVEQVPAVRVERPCIGVDDLLDRFHGHAEVDVGDELLERDDERRIVDDPGFAVDDVAELVVGLVAVVRACLRDGVATRSVSSWGPGATGTAGVTRPCRGASTTPRAWTCPRALSSWRGRSGPPDARSVTVLSLRSRSRARRSRDWPPTVSRPIPTGPAPSRRSRSRRRRGGARGSRRCRSWRDVRHRRVGP